MLKECDVRNWQEAVASALVAAFEATFVLLDKHRAEVGMGYLYEVLCAMLEGASLQTCNAVFGYDVVHVVA